MMRLEHALIVEVGVQPGSRTMDVRIICNRDDQLRRALELVLREGSPVAVSITLKGDGDAAQRA